MERYSSKEADKGLKGWSTGVANVEVIGAGFSSGGNTLNSRNKEDGEPLWQGTEDRSFSDY